MLDGPSPTDDAASERTAQTAGATSRRRRDRHGRGLRGPLLPAGLPAHRTRRQQFDDLVLDAAERLEERWGSELAAVQFAVEDVPPQDPAPWEGDAVPFGRLLPAEGGRPHRVVVYRRPLETRAPDRTVLAPLVHEVVVEQVAHLLGLDPTQVDPRLDED